jgi:hypothetical protein
MLLVKMQTHCKKTERRRKSKVFRLPFLISQQKRLFYSSSFTIQMSLGVFRAKFPMEMKAAKVKKSHFFRLCGELVHIDPLKNSQLSSGTST